MNRYRCHKEVDAFQITDILPDQNTPGGYSLLDGDGGGVEVLEAYMDKHAPQVGGYYIKYTDDYESWSPADAFEGGYTLIEE